jgi:hypothetical protein
MSMCPSQNDPMHAGQGPSRHCRDTTPRSAQNSSKDSTAVVEGDILVHSRRRRRRNVRLATGSRRASISLGTSGSASSGSLPLPRRLGAYMLYPHDIQEHGLQYVAALLVGGFLTFCVVALHYTVWK